VGTIVNNTGSSHNVRFRFKLGTTTIMDTDVIALASSANTREWTCDVDMFIVSGTAQRAKGRLSISAPGAANWTTNNSNTFDGPGYGTATEDTSSAKNLILSIELSNTGVVADIHAWNLERVVA
jgi:hypothetical protein